jgi:hypothetical protein
VVLDYQCHQLHLLLWIDLDLMVNDVHDHLLLLVGFRYLLPLDDFHYHLLVDFHCHHLDLFLLVVHRDRDYALVAIALVHQDFVADHNLVWLLEYVVLFVEIFFAGPASVTPSDCCCPAPSCSLACCGAPC